jgi:predicted DNA-binding transcriptional regulator AlpA
MTTERSQAVSETATERRTMNVEDAAHALGISRASAYEAARKGELPGAIRIGGRVVVSTTVLERVLNGEGKAA